LNEVRFLGLAWLNSMLPIMVPQLFATAFNVFLLRQFYRTIPYELDEAALIDGCSRFGIFRRVILPLSKPALIIVGMFTFFWNWKDLMGPLIYLNSRDNTTISVGLTFLKNPKHIDWQLIMAAATISLVPVVILFVVGQRYIVRGITMTGMKA
jgi:multiple sugar transport system permease protein